MFKASVDQSVTINVVVVLYYSRAVCHESITGFPSDALDYRRALSVSSAVAGCRAFACL